MNYFLPGLWHLAAAMAFACTLGTLHNGDATHFLREWAFVIPCVISSSALFFIPQRIAKKGAMKFLHYPLPDWDVLLLGPASHRHWITHSPILPATTLFLAARYASLGESTLFRIAAIGLCIGVGSHLFWDCVSSRSHKIVFLPYWIAFKPSWSRIYLLSGAATSVIIAFLLTGATLRPVFAEIATSSTRSANQIVTTENTPSLKPVKLADLENPEGVSVAPNGEVFAVDMTNGRVVKVVKGVAETWLQTSVGDVKSVPNGSKFWKRTLFVADSGRKQIIAVEPNKSFQIVADATRDGFTHGPNDLSFARDGSIYFSTPKWDALSGVYFCKRDKKGVWKTTLFADGFKFPNGVAVSPDGKFVFVGENQKNRIWKIERRKDGGAGAKTSFNLPPVPQNWMGPDGMRFDNRGRLFATQFGTGKIHVLTTDGRVLATLDAGGSNPTNVAFSPDFKTLYVSENQTKALYKIDICALRSLK